MLEEHWWLSYGVMTVRGSTNHLMFASQKNGLISRVVEIANISV